MSWFRARQGRNWSVFDLCGFVSHVVLSYCTNGVESVDIFYKCWCNWVISEKKIMCRKCTKLDIKLTLCHTCLYEDTDQYQLYFRAREHKIHVDVPSSWRFQTINSTSLLYPKWRVVCPKLPDWVINIELRYIWKSIIRNLWNDLYRQKSRASALSDGKSFSNFNVIFHFFYLHLNSGCKYSEMLAISFC